jgi:hypothetical protein
MAASPTPRLCLARVRRWLYPYRRALSLAMIAPMITFELSGRAGWGLFGLPDRKARGLALAIGLLWFIFVSPHWADPAERDQQWLEGAL